MPRLVLNVCLLTLYFHIAFLSCINCSFINGYFWRCNRDTYWNFSHLQTQATTSYMSCALWCATTKACIGFNTCGEHDGRDFECTLFSKNAKAEFWCDSPLMSQEYNCSVSMKEQDDASKITENQEPCASTYEKIFETTHEGVVLYGNKSELIERVKLGVDVRILLWNFNSKDQLFSINQIEVNDQEVCAQSVLSTVNYIFFSRQVLLICTSGFIQEQRWIIGLDAKERDFTAFVKSTWFAGGKCRTPVTVLKDLSSALENGHDITTLVENNRLPFNWLDDLGTDVVAQFAWSVPLIASMANPYTSNFDGNCAWQSHVLSYSGFRYKIEWQSGTGEHVATVNDTSVQMTWLTDTDWTLVYENSDSGNPVFGTLFDLHDYVNNGGHRVRLVFGTFAAEADFLFIQNDIISAVVRGFTDTPYHFERVVTIVSTNGTVQKFIYGLASSVIKRNDTTSTGAKWYIDNVNWNELFRVQNGIVESSSSNVLEDAMYSGMAFRVIYSYSTGNISFAGDSVTLLVSEPKSMTVTVNRQVNFTTETGQFVLVIPVGNVFYEFISDGSVDVKIYDNGDCTPRYRAVHRSESFRWLVSGVWQNT